MSHVLWLADRLRRDITYVNSHGMLRRETGTGTPRDADSGRGSVVGDEADPFELRVLTMNVWGLYFLPHVEARVEALGERLHGYDVIALQEVWHARERDALRTAGRQAGLIYAHYFAGGIGFPFWPGSHGTGVLVLSRLPIVDVVWKRFLINGKPYKLHHSDYLAGRGVGLLRLSSPTGPIDVFVTHLHAMYVDNPDDDEYLSHRMGQAFETAQFIRATARAPLVVVMGDFNCWPNSVSMCMLRSFVSLRDAWDYCHPTSESRDAAVEDWSGCTFGTPDNAFSYKEGIKPQRLDYVMFATLDQPLSDPRIHWSLRECSLAIEFMDMAAQAAGTSSPPSRIPLSDHWGVKAVFAGSRKTPASGAAVGDDRQKWPLDSITTHDHELLQAAMAICMQGRKEANRRRSRHHRRTLFALMIFPLLWIIGFRIPIALAWTPFLVSGYCIAEMLLAQGVVTDEITSFNEILHQMKHLLKRQSVHSAPALDAT
ncbi:hypothetical protein PBRA_004476 [Plasmodiophora brassicae]|uniref:Endonuclease/exonuclease/phosphatase domain-containing protein n=1 Tax=Plasmodiophora brassicae TaxID=37360 RepID=A0A0G4IKQ8_PLABS|nr:hypothetical protein PBRA_004476 [Plasmodiophora brassicae]